MKVALPATASCLVPGMCVVEKRMDTASQAERWNGCAMTMHVSANPGGMR